MLISAKIRPCVSRREHMTTFSRRSSCLAVVGLWLALFIPTAARAVASHDGRVVELDQPAYTAHENQGSLTITIRRTGDLRTEQHVGYGVKRQDAQSGIDFDTVANHYIT